MFYACETKEMETVANDMREICMNIGAAGNAVRLHL